MIGHFLRDTLLRFLPHRSETGLLAIGEPGRCSPVLLTGNFALTVRRLQRALAGHHAWLLVADSKGINVWCAAGGGHLTHHQVISVIRTSGIAERVDHRRLVLPQLAATGVEAVRVQRATGFHCRWGPARLEDLPSCLDGEGPLAPELRELSFPLRDRLEMGVAWLPWLAPAPALIAALFGGWPAGLAVALACTLTPPLFLAALPSLPLRGPTRWATAVGVTTLGVGLCLGLVALLGGATPAGLISAGILAAAALATLGFEVGGTTPHLPSSFNAMALHARAELRVEACSGCGTCLQVCPTAAFELQGAPARSTMADPDRCITCAACVVQCPHDALHIRFPDGRVVEPATTRRTRLNLLGKRAVELGER